jgi:squalene-associated FAD-dependent desaturase
MTAAHGNESAQATTDAMQPRVAVVGAGLAGLAAAVTLQRSGARVHLFERSRLLGGKATSFQIDGVEVDNGQHVVLQCCTDFIDLARSLGMAETLRFQDRFTAMVLSRTSAPSRLRAAPLPAPLHLAMGFATYRQLRAADKARVARALLAARRPQHTQTDMATWLECNHQNAATRRAFWDPFLIPALNAPLQRVSAEDGLFVIRTAFLGGRDAARMGYSTVPLARLADRAAATCDVVSLRTPVVGVAVRDGVVVGVRTDRDDTVECDACVLAVPPQRAATILQSSDLPPITELNAFDAEPIIDVHLWYDRNVRGFDFAAILDSPVQWVFRKGPGYVCCSLSAAGTLVRRPQSELVHLCDSELRAVIPQLRHAKLVRSACTRDPEATFVPSPGLRRPGPRTSLPNLVLAGAWTDTGWPATMESAVRSGRAAARALAGVLPAALGSVAVTGRSQAGAGAREVTRAV